MNQERNYAISGFVGPGPSPGDLAGACGLGTGATGSALNRSIDLRPLEKSQAKDRTRDIDKWTKYLFDRSEYLSVSLARLESRLAPVLRSVPEPTEQSARADVNCPLGDALAQIATRLELMVERVETIESRLEL